MKKQRIAVDIDGTLRNLQGQLVKYLEQDHPDKVDKFREIVQTEYRSLDPLFDSRVDLFDWMYNERVFELFGMAQRIHPKVIDELNIFSVAAENSGYDVWIASVQRGRSISATLHWLAKWGCRVPNIMFFPTMQDKINENFDVYIDDCPEVIEATMGTKFNYGSISIPTSIKIPYGFTKDINVPELDIENGKFNDLYDILGVEKILFKE